MKKIISYVAVVLSMGFLGFVIMYIFLDSIIIDEPKEIISCSCSPQEILLVPNTIPNIEIVESIPIEPRYGFTDEEIYLLAQLLCGDESYEGDGEYDFVWQVTYEEMNYYEMSKVLCVVMNRVRNEDFPDTVSDVIFDEGQFADYRRTDTEPADIAIEKIREWCEAYDRWDPGVQSIPEDHLYYEAGPDLTNITGEEW